MLNEFFSIYRNTRGYASRAANMIEFSLLNYHVLPCFQEIFTWCARLGSKECGMHTASYTTPSFISSKLYGRFSCFPFNPQSLGVKDLMGH
jgi:hypothetical protein